MRRGAPGLRAGANEEEADAMSEKDVDVGGHHKARRRRSSSRARESTRSIQRGWRVEGEKGWGGVEVEVWRSRRASDGNVVRSFVRR